MTELRNTDISFRKLFDVKILEQHQTFVGISKQGDLLLITEELYGMVMLSCRRTVFRLDKSEFLAYVERARNKGKLAKAFANGWTSPDEIERLCR
ncbi:MAG: hypothetical protein IK130_00950 [Oscillospiraceae bacterium]|nr:hypothetical protein [Oscillospiraceae bacterium]